MVLTNTSAVARSLMEGMGWKEGEGLGKERQGRTSAVRPKKRTTNAGLGMGNSSNKWLAASSGYDAILAKLNVVYASPSGASEEEKNKKLTKEEKKARKEEKRARKEAKKAKKEKKAKNKVGENDENDNEEEQKRLRKEKKKAKKEKKEKKKEKKRKRENEEVDGQSASARQLMYSKRLNAKRVSNYSSLQKAEIFGGEKRGFTEQTQVNLYNMVMDSQVKGRKGLGLKSMSKSVRREVAQQDSQLLREGSYLSRKFLFGGYLCDMSRKEVQKEEDEFRSVEDVVAERRAKRARVQV